MSWFRLKTSSSLLSILPSSFSSSSLLFSSRLVLGNQRPVYYTSAIPTPALNAKRDRIQRTAPKPSKPASKVSCNWNKELKYTLGELRKSNDVFQRKNKLVQIATSIETLLPETTLEFAIMGRSNVGKSTLINRLTKNKLARVASYPKRTKSLNFYSINNGKLFLVDFPGYQPQPSIEQSREKEEFLYHYLSTRKSLKVLVLLDSQNGVQLSDFDLLTYLEDNQIAHQVILAKADLAPQTDFEKRVEDVQEIVNSHEFADKRVLYFSSTDKNTVDLIRAKLVEYGKFPHIKEKPLKKIKKQVEETEFATFREEMIRIQNEKEEEDAKELPYGKPRKPQKIGKSRF